MGNSKLYKRVRGMLYEASYRRIWDELLAEITQGINCESGVLLIIDRKNKQNIHSEHFYNVPLEHQRIYQSGLVIKDQINNLLTRHPNQVVYSQPQNLELFNAEVKQEFMILLGYQYQFGLSIPCCRRYALNLFFNSSESFTTQQQAANSTELTELIPLLCELLKNERQKSILNELQHTTGRGFDGFFVVDRNLKIQHFTPNCREILETEGCVLITNDTLQFMDGSIHKLVANQIYNGNCFSMLLTGPNRSFDITMIRATSLDTLYDWELQKETYILAFTTQPSNSHVSQRLVKLFGLTEGEIKTALNFIETPCIREISAETGRSPETIRNQLKQVMQKMDVHNQAALMKKLMGIHSL